MSLFYSKQDTYPNPYAEAKASLQRAASKKYYHSRFYETQSGQRGDYKTGSLYGDLKELQQETSV